VANGVDRILTSAGDVEQEESANDAEVLVKVDRVRVAVGALHRPEVVRDERGPQRVKREQEGQRARPRAESDGERDEELDHNRHERGEGGHGGANLRHVANGPGVVGELAPAEYDEEHD